jgi:2-isopropylmalate synthase
MNSITMFPGNGFPINGFSASGFPVKSFKPISSPNEKQKVSLGVASKLADSLTIFDPRLQGGEPPSQEITDKLEVARKLHKLGVKAIKTGFPASGSDSATLTRLIASEIGNGKNPPVIVAFARTVKTDIDAAWHAVKAALHPSIHIVAPAIEHELSRSSMSREHLKKENLEKIEQSIRHAKCLIQGDNRTVHIEFSSEDFEHANLDDLTDMFKTAIKAGATTVDLPEQHKQFMKSLLV